MAKRGSSLHLSSLASYSSLSPCSVLVKVLVVNQPTLNILKAMQPIDLSEMDSVRLMDRVDTKYVTNEQELEALLENVKEHYQVLTINNLCQSAYTTLYFDSPEHDSYLQHHNGKLNRHKLRMRKYLSTGLCFLEVKIKNSKGRTDKRRIPIPAIKESISEEYAASVDRLINYQSEFVPQLWTNFTRVTIVNRNSVERVTLDFDLEFSIGEKRQSLPGAVIAEIKQPTDNRGCLIRQQFRRQGVRPLRVSKYCLGIALLKPTLKSNRFKSKLRAISRIA